MEKYKNKKWLYSEYVTKKKTANEIAIEEGRNAKTIWNWLRKFEINTRPRGGKSSAGSFKKGSNLWLGRKHKESTKEKIRQASIKDGRVPYLKNGIHWLHSEGAISGRYKGGISPDRQAIYSSLEWKDCVKTVWKRDNASCRVCGIHQNKNRDKKFHIHHIESFAVKEKRTEADNLVLVCPKCHHFLHSKKNKNKLFIK